MKGSCIGATDCTGPGQPTWLLSPGLSSHTGRAACRRMVTLPGQSQADATVVQRRRPVRRPATAQPFLPVWDIAHQYRGLSHLSHSSIPPPPAVGQL